TADTAPGFHYAYDCNNVDLSGSTYASTPASTAPTSSTYVYASAHHTVKARIIDKDGGFSQYTTPVHVNNVAPTADLSASSPINRSEERRVGKASQPHPSHAHTADSGHNAYECKTGDHQGATYAHPA